MALTINTIKVLNDYITGVMERADHHGQNVNEIALAIAGAIIWKVTEDIEVKEYDGQTKNVLWMTVNGSRYALSYNHNAQTIELRNRSTQGNVIASFTNSTPITQVKNIFNGL